MRRNYISLCKFYLFVNKNKAVEFSFIPQHTLTFTQNKSTIFVEGVPTWCKYVLWQWEQKFKQKSITNFYSDPLGKLLWTFESSMLITLLPKTGLVAKVPGGRRDNLQCSYYTLPVAKSYLGARPHTPQLPPP